MLADYWPRTWLRNLCISCHSMGKEIPLVVKCRHTQTAWMVGKKERSWDSSADDLGKMNSLISGSIVGCGSPYLGQHQSPISPYTLCYKTRKGLSFQKLSHKADS
jgi:hypothetical protein